MTVYRFTVNGAATEVDVPGMRRLLDVLREDLALTGTKEGCGEGRVRRVHGPARRGAGRQLSRAGLPGGRHRGPDGRRTGRSGSAGSAEPPTLDPLQAAFLETGGAQCGICTPGMLLSARAYLDAGGGPDEDAIRDAIAGNLCRCTGYTKIIDAIAMAARDRIGGMA